MPPKRFNKKNSQRYVVVHRPHDDPHFYDDGTSSHVLIPVENPNAKKHHRQKVTTTSATPKGHGLDATHDGKAGSGTTDKDTRITNKNVGQAILYGIEFNDSNYDYTQHLRSIGEHPDAVFIPAKPDKQKGDRASKKSDIDSIFVEPAYQSTSKDSLSSAKRESVFQRGMAKPEYLLHQQNIPDNIKGFQPDMNPALREVLEALDDDAYVVNKDTVIHPTATSKAGPQNAVGNENQNEALSTGEGLDDEDELFGELLAGGEAEDADEFDENFDEWDVDNLDAYEEEHYKEEMEKFANVENLEDLRDIDYQADVRRFQKSGGLDDKYNSDDEFDDLSEVGVTSTTQQGLVEGEEEEEGEEGDVLGELPNIQSRTKDGKSRRRKERRRKGAMSDISGFSMSSSVLSRSETMTVLDDRYDQIIGGYENYEEEQEKDEENYEPFDMSKERSDFESLMDDFLDNYELESGGRKLVKKDSEVQRYKTAAINATRLNKKGGKQNQPKFKSKTHGKSSANSLAAVTGTLNALRL